MIKKTLVFVLTGLLLLTSIGMVNASNLTKTEVSQLYVSIFGRASEGDGNAYWCSTQDDMTVAANTMLATTAAQSYFGSTLNDNQLFIEFIYENTLGKTYAEDPDGATYWVSELANGKSKGQVVATLINAAIDPQYVGLPSQDQFINKVEVCNYTADTIASCPDVNDLSMFVDFIANVTDGSATVVNAKATVDTFNPASEDDYYPDNISTSGTLNPGSSITGNLEAVGDTDWFSINLVSGTEYTIDLTSSEVLDNVLFLMDANGNEVDKNDDGLDAYSDSQIKYTPTSSGKYYLVSDSYQSRHIGYYTLSVSYETSSTENEDEVEITLETIVGTWKGSLYKGPSDWSKPKSYNDKITIEFYSNMEWSASINTIISYGYRNIYGNYSDSGKYSVIEDKVKDLGDKFELNADITGKKLSLGFWKGNNTTTYGSGSLLKL